MVSICCRIRFFPQGTPPEGGAGRELLLQNLLATDDVHTLLGLAEALASEVVDGSIDH